MGYDLSSRDTSELSLVGSFVEVYWTATSRLAKRQCERCVYVVRGAVEGLVCVELVYDAIDGEHRKDAIYWVPLSNIQYLRVLTRSEAEHRIERLEREALENMPKD